MKQALALVIVWCSLVTVTWGNAPPPPGYRERPAPPSVTQSVDVRNSDPGELPAGIKAKLIIAPGNQAAIQKLFPQAIPDAPKTEAPKSSALPAGGTIIAGVALSLTVLSSVWLMRRSPDKKWMSLSIIVIGLSCATASLLWADIAIPGQPYRGPARRPEPEPAPAPVVVQDQMIIELGDKSLEKNVLILGLPAEKK